MSTSALVLAADAGLLPAGLTLGRYAGMGAMVAVAACLQGIGGLGFAMFSAPVAGLFFPELAPGPLLVLGGSLSLLSAVRERQAIDWRGAGGALAGRAVGTLLAAWVIVLLPPRPLAVVFALMILAGVAASLAGRGLAPSPRNIALAGVASGLMGTITSAGAPPFALVMQHLPPARLRATLGCIFAAGATLSLAVLAAVGRFGWSEAVLGALLAPCMVAGFMVSGLLGPHVSGRSLRGLLLGLAALGAVGILMA